MMDLVTVVIPVYKTFEYLKECVDSVIGQAYKNLEIILVDDGSPDASAELCDEYAKKDSRIKVIHRENGGLSAARNSGIKAACGKYITFIDSDDIVDENMIGEMVQIAQKENAQIVKSVLIRTNTKDDCISSEGKYVGVTPYEALTLIYSGPPQIISACGKLFDVKLFDDVLFPEGLNHEDEYTVPKLFYRANKIILCDSVRYFYMQRPGDSIMRSDFSPKKMDVIVVAEDRISFFRSCGYKDLEKKAIQDYFVHLINLRSKAKKSQYQEEYRTIDSKVKAFKFKHLSNGQKVRLALFKLNLYDMLYK